MTERGRLDARKCAKLINSLHSVYYFAPEPEAEFSRHGVTDSMRTYLVGRVAPLGAVGPGVVTALFNTFSHQLIAEHLPAAWAVITPADALRSRSRACEAAFHRLLGADVEVSTEVAEAAKLAVLATGGCVRSGRPLSSANADLDVPGEPLLALWHAATLLREYRGDSHWLALGYADLHGLDALVFDCASPAGMPADIVMSKRGWSEREWLDAERRLQDRRLMDMPGKLTPLGSRLRGDIEAETDRLDWLPYQSLGPTGVARLTLLVRHLVIRAADAGAFPPPLRDFFVTPPFTASQRSACDS